MSNAITVIKNYLKQSFQFKTLFMSSVSTVFTLFFAYYSFALGYTRGLDWYYTICKYCLMLCSLRFFILWREGRTRHLPAEEKNRKLHIDVHISYILLLAINLYMVKPVVMMIRNQRPFPYKDLPAFLFEVYTVYKIIFSFINLKKSQNIRSILVRELRTINVVDAMMSVLILQHTLIIVYHIQNGMLMTYVKVSSAVVMVVIITFTLFSYRKAILKVHERMEIAKKNEKHAKEPQKTEGMTAEI